MSLIYYNGHGGLNISHQWSIFGLPEPVTIRRGQKLQL
jgi:hypothetical protein